MEIEMMEQQDQHKIQPEKRRTRVGAWRNRDEFQMVYLWLFDVNANDATKEKACKQMFVWKLRRVNFTPASILSTLVLIQVQLKDAIVTKNDDIEKIKDLQIYYSSAFTRFLNYMSSVAQNSYTKSMYEAAKELNIESFVVDLRHLCAHGQQLPALETLRQTAEYCLKWLKEHYWDIELANIQDVDATSLRHISITTLDINITEIFQIYDIVTETIMQNCSVLEETHKYVTEYHNNLLHKYCMQLNENNLSVISEYLIKKLSLIVQTENQRISDLSQIFIESFLKMNYFFETAAKCAQPTDTDNEVKLIQIHRYLFRAIAFVGLLDDLFNKCLEICENQSESLNKCKGIRFWCNKMAEGLQILYRFRNYCKLEIDKSSDFLLNIKDKNTNKISDNLRRIYTKVLKVNVDTVLIFGENSRLPWSLAISRKFLNKRFKKSNCYTRDAIKCCISLCTPAISKHNHTRLCNMLDIYMPKILDDQNMNKGPINDEIEYDMMTRNDKEIKDVHVFSEKIQNEPPKKYGIWTILPDNPDWSKCPLGNIIS